MSIPLLFLLFAVAGLGSKAFSKLCSIILNQNSVAKYSLVLVINSLVACLFFGIVGGFKIAVNSDTLLYSTIYAVIAAVSIVSNVVVYRYVSISNVNIVSSSCGMVCTAVIGWMCFHEKLDILNATRIVIMLVAIVFVFFDQKNNETITKPTTERKIGNIFSLAIIIAIISLSLLFVNKAVGISDINNNRCSDVDNFQNANSADTIDKQFNGIPNVDRINVAIFVQSFYKALS